MSEKNGARVPPASFPRFSTQTGLLAAVYMLAALIPLILIVRTLPGARSGVFLYIGFEVLQGKVPYRDLWSQQAPLIFYINALGLSVSGGRAWGAWLLEWLALLGAALFLFSFLRRFFGMLPAAFAAVAMLMSLTFVWDGGLPETYGLLVQAAILWILGKGFVDGSNSRRLLIIVGILAGLLVLLQTWLVAIGITAGLIVLLFAIWERKPVRSLLNVIWIVSGMMAVIGLGAAFFAANHALSSMLDQVIRFNLPRSGGEMLRRLNGPVGALGNLFFVSGFFCLGAVSWLAVIPHLVLQDARFRALALGRFSGAVLMVVGLGILFNGLYNDTTKSLYAVGQLSAYRVGLASAGALVGILGVLMAFGVLRRGLYAALPRLSPTDCSPALLPLIAALIDLPLEIALWATFNRGGVYSPLPLMPALSILAAFLLWSLRPAPNAGVHPLAASLPCAAVAAIVFGSGTAPLIAPTPSPDTLQVESMAVFIKEHIQPAQSILPWGENGRLYWLSGRSSPTRLVEQTPLFAQGYSTPAAVEGYLADLRSAHPDWIVDTRSRQQPLLTIDDPARCADLESETVIRSMLIKSAGPRAATEDIPYVPASMGKVYRWFCENYQQAALVGDQQWIVYRRR